MSKYFIIDESVKFSSKKIVEQLEKQGQDASNKIWGKREDAAEKTIQIDPPFEAPIGRVIIKVDIEYKNQAAFNGGTIRLERQFNELNRRLTEPVNAIVVNSHTIPTGAEVIIHHNALHETNKINDCEDLIEGEVSPDIKYFSIKENECFLWRKDNKQWQPCTNFDTALRVFIPYNGILEGIEPTKIKDVLYVTSGNYKGLVVATIKACDFELVFNDGGGKEHRIIRFRPNGDKDNQREEEAIAVLDDMTQKVNKGELLIGLNPNECTKINI